MSAVPIWIDTGAGSDDAIALMTAVRLEQMGLVRICGISVVFGNVECDKAFINARNVLALLNREDIPVYKGADHPLVEKLETTGDDVGSVCMGGAVLPVSSAEHQTMPAWDAIWECACREEDRLQLILIGPETNAALALQKYPLLKGRIARILVMGGAEIGGSKTPAAEYHIWADPHAAQKVFKSGIPIVMCGLDVTMKAVLLPKEIDEIKSGGNSMSGLFLATAGKVSKNDPLCPAGSYIAHASCPILYCAFPDIFTGENAGVFVETQGTITRGKTVSDRDTDVKFPAINVFLVLDLDRERFAGFIVDTLLAK